MTNDADRLQTFERTWANPLGFPHTLSEVNNQPIGKWFMATAFIFFILGGVLALLMRVQLAVPENDFLGPQVYNQLFTMHGSTMMFLFAVPFLEGLALYLLPAMIGSRDLAFPRLSAFSYWMFLLGGLVFYASFFTGDVPDAGWFAYPPLSGPQYTGIQQDYWLLGLAMVEIAGITTAAEIVVTILKFRAPGMTLARMPLFAWTMLVVSIMIIFAFTTLLMATLLLELDRAAGTHFFNPDMGGHTLLWQHLFWFFGHPEVYIMFLPATGIVSMVVAASAGRLIGYVPIVVAIVVTGFLSFGLWVHHMYTTGLPELAMHFFAAASLMIAIASGIQVFAWITTLWGTGPPLHTPMLFLLGFLFVFILGGFTGVMIAVVPFDWQVHDTFFIVAHFHYVLIGGVLFPVFAGLHFYLPKVTGRMLNEPLGTLSFWLTFIGFNATFFPMHVMGFYGLPRRVYTYPQELGIDWHNLLATVGSFVLGAGTLVFLVNLAWSLWRGRQAGTDPWGADTLEWSLPSPLPNYSHVVPPVVHSRHPMWAGKKSENPEPGKPGAEEVNNPPHDNSASFFTALYARPTHWRATLATDALYATPQAIQWLSGPTYLPLFAAMGLLVGLVATLYQYYLVLPLGVGFTAVVVVMWAWPSERRLAMQMDSDVGETTGLPVFPTGTRAVGWWGMMVLLAVLATAFAVLVYAYFYLWLFSEQWPQDGLAKPELLVPAMALGGLVISSATQWWASRQFHVPHHQPGKRPGSSTAPLNPTQRRHTALALAGTFILGTAFLAWQIYQLFQLPFAPTTNAYGSLVHVTQYMLTLILLIALAMQFSMFVRLRHDPKHHGHTMLQMQVTAMFWHFTVIVAALVYLVLYVTPHAIGH